MRSMTVFNFLLEATVIGSVIILLVIAVRALLRDRLGSRAIYAAWLLVALRLLLPLSLPNPVMDEFRPGFSVDVAARPVADQVRQRVIDASYSASTLLDGVEGGALEALAQHTSSGVAGKWILLGWLCVALALGGGMAWRNARFRARVKRDRVRALEGDEQTMLESLCRRYRVKPVPVYFVDHLPSACLIGVVRPFIAVPLDTSPEHLSLVLAHELLGLGPEGGRHHLAHEAFVRGARLLGAALAHGFGGKAHVVVHIQRTGLVVGVKLGIAAGKVHRVGPADADGELAPLVVGVERQQRVVQVEQGQPGAMVRGFSHSFLVWLGCQRQQSARPKPVLPRKGRRAGSVPLPASHSDAREGGRRAAPQGVVPHPASSMALSSGMVMARCARRA